MGITCFACPEVSVGPKVELQMVHEVPKRHAALIFSMKRFRTVLEKAAMGMGRWAWPARQVWNQLRKASGACNMASLEVWKVPVTEGFDLCDTQGDIPLY